MDAHQPPIHPVVPPPAIYDHAYNGNLTVRQGTMAQVEYYCHTKQGINGRNCFVMIPRIGGQVTASVQAQIRRHEIAHCNGWPADHPR